MRQKFIDWRPSEKSAVLVEYCNNVLDEYERQGYILTLRQLYYQLVARDIIPNNIKQYNNLGNMVNNARLAGLMDWKRIEDRVRRPESNSHWKNPEDIVSAAAKSYYRDHWDGQDRYVELWSEKDAVSNILHPVCEKWDITFMANRGYSSASAMYRASKRFIKAMQENKEIMILYFGDHDPSGLDMDRDIRKRIALMITAKEDIILGPDNFKRIALTMEQIEEYKPPENPAKETDSRHDKYVAEYGNNSYELDALEPRVLADLAEEEIQSHLDSRKFWAIHGKQQEEAGKIVELIKFLK